MEKKRAAKCRVQILLHGRDLTQAPYVAIHDHLIRFITVNIIFAKQGLVKFESALEIVSKSKEAPFQTEAAASVWAAEGNRFSIKRLENALNRCFLCFYTVFLIPSPFCCRCLFLFGHNFAPSMMTVFYYFTVSHRGSISVSGGEAFLYSIQNDRGMRAVVTNYGAIPVSLLVPCADGTTRDVVLGYDTLAEYEAGGFFGATVGRSANRISGAAFTLDGVRYALTGNDNGCNLHSDFQRGFHKQLWEAEILPNGVRFSRLSPDGECGFPGNLRIRVSYLLENDNRLRILYEGVSDRKTIINLTNHSFFNLVGHDAPGILDERLTLHCDRFLEISEGRLPTGRILPVDGTPMDFRAGRRIGDEMDAQWDQRVCFSFIRRRVFQRPPCFLRSLPRHTAALRNTMSDALRMPDHSGTLESSPVFGVCDWVPLPLGFVFGFTLLLC